jgi:hypothetical protein
MQRMPWLLMVFGFNMLFCTTTMYGQLSSLLPPCESQWGCIVAINSAYENPENGLLGTAYEMYNYSSVFIYGATANGVISVDYYRNGWYQGYSNWGTVLSNGTYMSSPGQLTNPWYIGSDWTSRWFVNGHELSYVSLPTYYFPDAIQLPSFSVNSYIPYTIGEEYEWTHNCPTNVGQYECGGVIDEEVGVYPFWPYNPITYRNDSSINANFVPTTIEDVLGDWYLYSGGTLDFRNYTNWYPNMYPMIWMTDYYQLGIPGAHISWNWTCGDPPYCDSKLDENSGACLDQNAFIGAWIAFDITAINDLAIHLWYANQQITNYDVAFAITTRETGYVLGMTNPFDIYGGNYCSQIQTTIRPNVASSLLCGMSTATQCDMDSIYGMYSGGLPFNGYGYGYCSETSCQN